MKRVCMLALLISFIGACGDSGGPALEPTTITTTEPAPDSCRLGEPTDLNALVTDINGRPVPNVVVTFTVETGGGTVSPLTATTDANGIAATVFTCAAPVLAEPVVVVASFEGVEQNSARWALMAHPGTLAQIDFAVFSTPDSVPVVTGFAQPLGLVGLLRDGFGGSPPATVTWEITSGGGSLSEHSTEAYECCTPPGTPAPWRVRNFWTLGAVGLRVQEIRLTSPDSPDFQQRFHVRVVPGPITVIAEPPSALSGEAGSVLPAPLAVRVLAGDGSPIPRVVVHFRAFGELEPINPADTAFTASHVYTDRDGRAAMHYTLPTKADGLTYTTLADAFIIAEDGQTRSAFWSLLVLPGPPVQLGPPSGSDQSGSVGQPLGEALAVTVQDQFGNGVDGQAVSWTVTSGGGTLAESTTASNQDGLHLNIWTLGPTPGVQTVAASFGGVTVTFTAHASSGS